MLDVRQDVAVYTASALTPGFYDRARGRAGGAERQMTLLARALAARGFRVAHIVYPPRDPVPLPDRLTLVPRASHAGNRALVGGLLEAVRIWRALKAADANVAIVRSGSPVLGIVAAFCRLHRRVLIFSSSNNADFTLAQMSSRLDRSLYRLGIQLADAVVVQSEDQLLLAGRLFPSLRRLEQIPSFAETVPLRDAKDPEAFLWFSRLAPYKQPMRYVELARAVPEARFVMIPVVERPESPELQTLRAAATTAPNLQLVDPVPHEELSRLIAQTTAVVNTSAYEGMPNAFLEAWAHGVPVLTLEFDPDAAVARNGLGISAGGSWERFIEGARELWERPDRRDELGSRARRYVNQVHSIDVVGSRWRDLLGELRQLRGADSDARPAA
jgi:glycosyltransferase involved in cell wall biosynthesis